MKPLAKMSPAEKALLLHQLFPEEIIRFISYVDDATKVIIENPNISESPFKRRKLSAASWVQLARNIQDKLTDHRDKIERDSQIFAIEFFTGYSIKFMMACLQDYINICTDFQFRLTIEGWFEI